MKKTLLVFAFVPCTVFAQQAQTNLQTGKPSVSIHYQKARIHSNEMASEFGSKPGEITIVNDTLHISSLGVINMDCKTKRKHRKETSDLTVVASGVHISDASNPVSINADKLEFSNETKKGVLTGNITSLKNGKTRTIGKRAEIDLSKNEYRIVSIR